MRYYLAIDIGASSGRHILAHTEAGKLILEEIYRFDNKQQHKNRHDCWDLDNLVGGVMQGLAACRALGKIPETVGIDTWGVDYVLLDENDAMLGDAVAYRDARTEGVPEEVSTYISPSALYAKTGIARQPFNTIYQLTALKKEAPELLKKAKTFLMIPDYLNFLLTGVKVNEYTNATTTGLVNARTKKWDEELLDTLGFPKKIFGKLAMPGTVVGKLAPAVREKLGFDTTVILPATHDTGSAFLAVPAKGEGAVYLSSGTWSLLGVENSEPLTDEESRRSGFTNEGGAWYRFRYLQNIMGLWMIQSVRRELNGINYIADKQQRTAAEHQWTFNELVAEAKKNADFPTVIDVNRDRFLSPVSMIDEIKAECAEMGAAVPSSVGELMQCIYQSLARCYKNAIVSLTKLTGKTYDTLHIVGGGCRDDYLSELTAKETGLTVFAGPAEGTSVGNIVIQLIAAGEVADLAAARQMIRDSFEIQEVAK